MPFINIPKPFIYTTWSACLARKEYNEQEVLEGFIGLKGSWAGMHTENMMVDGLPKEMKALSLGFEGGTRGLVILAPIEVWKLA